jgi:hypothetical protein
MAEASDRLSDLSPQQLDALQNRLQEESDDVSEGIPVRSDDGPVPLTRAQRPYWFRSEIYSDQAGNNLTLPFRLRGDLDPDRLATALKELVNRHAIFRTTFERQDGVPQQQPHPDKELTVDRIDLSDYAADVRGAQLKETIQKMAGTPFDLGSDLMMNAAIVRLGDQEHALILVVHHLVFDYGSLEVLWSELSALYEAAKDDVPEESAVFPDELPIQYADYAAWEKNQHESGAFDDQLEYWNDQLEDTALRLPLPVDRLPDEDGEPALSEEVETPIPGDLMERVRAFSLEENVTTATTLFAAYQILLYRLTGEGTFVVAYPTTSRHRAATRSLIGPFSNDLPQRADVAGDDTAREVVGRVHQRILAGRENADVSIQELLQALPGTRRRAADRVTSTSFNVMKRGLDAEMAPGLDIEPIKFGEKARMPIEVQLMIIEHEDGFSATLTYDVELYDESTIEMWMDGYLDVLEQIVARPDARVRDLEIPSDLASWAESAPMDEYEAMVDNDDVEYVEPETPIEEMLAEMWEDLLDVERVGRKHDFFFAGGHSLTATVLTTRIRDAFGVNVSLIDVFRSSKLHQLGGLVEKALIDDMDDEAREKEMQDVQDLDEDEINEELSGGIGTAN